MKQQKEKKENILIYIYIIVTVFVLYITPFFIKENISSSSPQGIYLREFGKNFNVGDYIVYDIPQEYSKFSDPELKNLKVIKKIYAVENDKILIEDSKIYINKEFKGLLQNIQSKIQGEYTLKKGEYFTLSENPYSLDSRYYGVILKKDIKYKAKLIYRYKENDK